MLRSSSIFPAALALLLAAQSGPLAQHASYAPADAPERLRPAISEADAIFGELQQALLSALTTELAAGGPTQALSVCHTEAEPIARRVAADRGIRVGRTSHRLRNAGNAPPPWAEPFVAPPASGLASDAKPVAVDLGDRVGVLRPIGTVALCTTCHGPASTIRPEAREKLQTLYPHDQAVGFQPGDLRGWMWAEVPLTRRASGPSSSHRRTARPRPGRRAPRPRSA